ncbi:MAG: YoaK family protein [Alysiella sp.]|uniref:YoaK family protein n=1 Tax=Alysiella sp. TaxID=1872483 RepID=UPI0026DCEB84|nr:YoaK family protein [Alysiella sp.]MDO4434038.1 YoaK family protein [Alysiella sp.]
MSARKHRFARPFWQADKPDLHNNPISDLRFRLLAYVMTALAGAINAGGFFAVARYTSHVTGALSQSADELYLGNGHIALSLLLGVVAFILGAAHSGWTVLWAKRHRFRSSYGLSMWLEALYLLLFGLSGLFLPHNIAETQTILLLLLCFIMGMHNTVMTVLSGGAVRSTHMTGTATDLGIELAKMLYYRHDDNPRLVDVRVNRPKMRLLSGLFTAFILGGLIGAWGYHQIGYHFTLPVAAILGTIAWGFIHYDIRLRWRWWRNHVQHKT